MSEFIKDIKNNILLFELLLNIIFCIQIELLFDLFQWDLIFNVAVG